MLSPEGTLWSGAKGPFSAGDDRHRPVGMLGHLSAGTAQKQLRGSTQAAAADHDQLGVGGVGDLEEHRNPRAVPELGPVGDPGAGQWGAPHRLERLLDLVKMGLGRHRVGVRLYLLEQTQGVDRHHLGPCPAGLIDRPLNGHLAVGGAVDSHYDHVHRRISLPGESKVWDLSPYAKDGGGPRLEAVLVENGLELLTEEECRALLCTQSVGRIAVSVGALPVILPVNYTVVDDDIVFMTGEGLKLRAALESTVVGFEIDSLDEALDYGWSVLVVGVAKEVAEGERDDLGPIPVRPWAGGDRSHLVRIHPEMISGRRIVPPEAGAS
jgi:uncharacterized protein